MMLDVLSKLMLLPISTSEPPDEAVETVPLTTIAVLDGPAPSVPVSRMSPPAEVIVEPVWRRLPKLLPIEPEPPIPCTATAPLPPALI
jgi:hypothetical protein